MLHVSIPSYQHRDIGSYLLWHVLRFNPKPDADPRPGWNRYMSMTYYENCSGKSIVHMLPIIDLDANDIYSTLSLIVQQSQELHISIPVHLYTRNCSCN